MSESLSSFIILTLYAIISFVFHLLIVRSKSFGYALVFALIQIVGTCYLFHLLKQLINTMRMKGIYFEFGHGDFDLYYLAFLCFIIAIVNSIVALVRREKKFK